VGERPKPLQHGTGEYQPPGYPTTTAFGVPTRFVPGPLNSGRLNQALDELQAQIGTGGGGTYSVKLVTTSWVLNGANTTFPMLDTTGDPRSAWRRDGPHRLARRRDPAGEHRLQHQCDQHRVRRPAPCGRNDLGGGRPAARRERGPRETA
jgi:hypothetical protein